MSTYFLGIDLGTTDCKVGVYDVNGQKLASGNKTYKVDVTPQGAAEVDPQVWVAAVVDGVRDAVARSKIDPRGIAGIAVGGTNGLVPVRKDGSPSRRAIMLMDQRSGPQAEKIASILGRDRCFNEAGNVLVPGMLSSPIILWIKENEPEVYEKTYKFLVPAGYVNLFLTGKFTMDRSRASMTLLFNQVSGQWIREFCEALGIDFGKLPEVYESHEVIGTLMPESAEAMGLPAGIPVVAGCTDTVAASVGSGAAGPGESYMILGTTGRVCVTSTKPSFHPRLVNTSHVTSDRWIHIAAMNSAGLALKWLRSVLGLENASYDEVVRLAEPVPPGANGVMFLPYLAGERSPIWDPKARGVFFGLSFGTDTGTIVRSVLEGIGYAFADNIEVIEASYGKLGRLKFGGGGARNMFWAQMIADITGKELAILDNPDLETLGCALVAGLGTGHYTSLEETSEYSAKTVSVVKPRNEEHEMYVEGLNAYRELYLALRPRFQHRAGTVSAR